MPAPSKSGEISEQNTALKTNMYISNLKLPLEARAVGGSSHNNDIEIFNTETDELIECIEDKSNNSSRTDYGQFRIAYDENQGWYQATGVKKPELVELFTLIKPGLDKQLQLPHGAPSGPKLTYADAVLFWNIVEPGRTKSLKSGDILEFKIDPSFIDRYYRAKGNGYLKIGEHIYSLKKDDTLPLLSSMVKDARALLRVKYHKTNHHSYTVALRINCNGSEETVFDSAITEILSSLLK